MNRRYFLRTTGIGLALPFLDAMLPRSARAAEAAAPKRLVTICASLGIHGPDFFPTAAGTDYEETRYLRLLKEHRKDYTVFSGLSHPEQAGRDGHASEFTWLTSAVNPGLGGFRNTISLDQKIAEKIGYETRFPSLALNTSGGTSQSYTRSGVMIPAESKPSTIFTKLFIDGTPAEIAKQQQKLREGRSIMDTVREEAKRVEKRLGKPDQEKLEEYFTSVREMEIRLQKAEEWVLKPKPKITDKLGDDVKDEKDLIGRMNLICDLVPLALQTDSTRLITILIQGRGDVPTIPGVNMDHHNLSHHGQDQAKIDQLRIVEEAQMNALNRLLGLLKSKQEGAQTLLDNTMVFFGSNLGNANSHDWHNLPIILAGGGFKHGSHQKFDEKNNVPLSNLFVAMQQQMGVELDKFGTSSGRLSWS
jgi:hypothetical protein